MILNGELEIQHEGHYSKKIKQFEQDQFSGNWITTGKGKVIDFNVIYRPNYSVVLKHLSLMSIGNFSFINGDKNLIFLYKGQLLIEGETLKQGEMLEIEGKMDLKLVATDAAELILVNIKN